MKCLKNFNFKGVLWFWVFILPLILFTGNALAEIYRSELTIGQTINDKLEFMVETADIDVFAVVIDGKAIPVMHVSGNQYIANNIPAINPQSKITFISKSDDNNLSGQDIKYVIKHDNGIEKKESPGLILDVEPLKPTVTDSLRIGTAGVLDTHRVGFEIHDEQIPEYGEIWIAFNGGFDVAGIDPNSVVYEDNDVSNDGNEPQIIPDSFTVIAQTVIIPLDNGTPAVPNSRINIEFSPVRNIIAGDYIITVMVFDDSGNILYSPTASGVFTIAPDELDYIEVAPGNDINISSDSIIVFTASGYDQYDNEITGLDYDWAITVDSCGFLDNGTFRAIKLGECYITAETDSKIDSSGLITIIPGEFSEFGLTGYPDSTDAGASFPIGTIVYVAAYDINNNIIYDYSGSIYFFSSDTIADIIYDENNLYDFQPVDSGRVNFDRNHFIFKRAGFQTLNVTNITDTTISALIKVIPGNINSLTLSCQTNQTAGMPFSLSAANAVDEFGNAASGIVFVDASEGGGFSPGGVPPTYNNISVTNGSGSAFQTLTKATTADSTVLKGSVLVGGDFFSGRIYVNPSFVDNITLTNYPDSVIAGQPFPSPANDPVITVTDAYGNTSANYRGTVEFSGASSAPTPYEYTAVDSGVHAFSGSEFIFTQVGAQNLIAADQDDNSLTDTSEFIYVTAAEGIASFTLSGPGTIVAGEPFNLTVSNAVDAYGNPASGTVAIAITSGGGDSPNGVPPTVNNITVNNGNGSASQTLANVNTTTFRGTANGAVETVDIIVQAGQATRISLTNYPDIATAGEGFSTDPIVTVYDLYGNLSDGYRDTIAFSGASDSPSDYPFTAGDAGQHTFSGNNFAFNNAGSNRLIVTDSNNNLADTSSIIEVYASPIIASFTLTAPA
ncbi:MAG: hypothetical protein J7K40_06055, partial [candidate division Zixibacteria bacterium]|nr:hypothetical protein [candidate division Zixibacteria bacterium]